LTLLPLALLLTEGHSTYMVAVNKQVDDASGRKQEDGAAWWDARTWRCVTTGGFREK
jgi:hypothetical protein